MMTMLKLLPFCFFVTTVWAQDAVPTAPATQGDGWTILIGHILADIVFPLAGTGLLTLIMFLVHKLTAKFHVDQISGVQNLIDDAVKKGIHYAEAWAEAQKVKPLSTDKAQQAFDFIKTLVGDPMIRQYGEQKIQQLIESLLHSNPPVTPTAPSPPLLASAVPGT